MKIMNKKKLLILNISTDSKDTSLGFAISWLNIFSKECDEVNVITLNKGDISNLNENISIYEVENKSKIRRLTSFIKIFYRASIKPCSTSAYIVCRKFFFNLYLFFKTFVNCFSKLTIKKFFK